MSDQHIETQPENPPPLSIGSQLQEARQAKKLSETEVASELRVSKSIITYIEGQQWDKLPARTYARGYFANYVRFIGLPYEEMMAQFDLTYSVATRHPELKQIGAPAEKKKFPWATSIAIVSLLLILWFAYQEWQQAQNIQQQPESELSATDGLAREQGEVSLGVEP